MGQTGVLGLTISDILYGESPPTLCHEGPGPLSLGVHESLLCKVTITLRVIAAADYEPPIPNFRVLLSSHIFFIFYFLYLGLEFKLRTSHLCMYQVKPFRRKRRVLSISIDFLALHSHSDNSLIPIEFAICALPP
jgi:hypothetical protein